MTDDKANSPLNRGCILSFIGLAVIPAIAMLGAFFWVFRVVPIGEPTACEVSLTPARIAHLTVQTVQSGNQQYEQMRLEFTIDARNHWRTVLDSTHATPLNPTCETHVGQIDDDVIWAWGEKTLAASWDSGSTWATYAVCGEPLASKITDCDETDASITRASLERLGRAYLDVRHNDTLYSIFSPDSGERWLLQSR